MEKQTATEWLFKQLWEEPKDKFTWNAILDKANEMFEQQIMDAHTKAYLIGESYIAKEDADKVSIKYYNQTFKKD